MAYQINLPPPALRCKVDSSDLVTTLRRYAEVSGKSIETAGWRMLSKWSYQALGQYKAIHPSRRTLAYIPTLPGRKEKSKDWRLVTWLKKGRKVNLKQYIFTPEKEKKLKRKRRGLGPLTRFAQTELGARRKSVGFSTALILAAAKSAKRKMALVTKTGIRAATSQGGSGVINLAVQSVYNFRNPKSRANQSRNVSRMERYIALAFRATLRDIVYDMEKYIARKAQEAAAKTGLAPRLTASSDRVKHLMEVTRGY